ncbi:YbhB/YbcL family Raf kinase inhibitor-like protein [Actinoallomurus sp. NPDC052308]|uniref:YbhB/YbcL family Raf kinase inhibitor-like protein n=1 Tax=Actinoallomurus sp. NPDC052308 TaxID=3155530 RepID=UPI00344178D7
MKRSVRTFATVAGAAVLVGSAATAAAARDGHHGPVGDGGYGFTVIRKGVPDSATRMTLTSLDVRDGGAFPAGSWANAFGCSAGNRPLRLSWSGAPAATRSYAVTMYDPDAPSGSGFWHWLVWDIPTGDTTLGAKPPAGAVSGTNDAGGTGYLGPCPPAGDIGHRYQVTVYALNVAGLDLPADTPPAVATFTMSGHIVGYGRITATAQR